MWTAFPPRACREGLLFKRADVVRTALPPSARACGEGLLFKRADVVQVAQFDGLVEGYAARRQHELLQAAQAEGQSGGQGRARLEGGGRGVPGHMSRDDHLFLQNNGELYDIVDGYLAGAWGEGGGREGRAAGAAAGSSSSSSSRSAVDGSMGGRESAAAGAGEGRGDRAGAPPGPGRWLMDLALKGHCSALIKVRLGCCTFAGVMVAAYAQH